MRRTSQAGHRLFCDEMLWGLGRWLRAAGHDTAIAPRGLADRQVTNLARAESRILLTCDQALATRRAADLKIVALPTDGVDAAAHTLRGELRIDWLYAPFTRCLIDNSLLRPADAEARRALPPKARELDGPILRCPDCARLYWPGSHVRRMLARLHAWQHGKTPSASADTP